MKAKFRDAREAATYDRRWCRRCLHGPDCPVLRAATDEIDTGEILLDILIPNGGRGPPHHRCALFALNPVKAE